MHAQALHVLAADVEDELDVGDEGLGTAKVSDGLDLAGVGAEGLDEQGLAVARRGDVADGATLGELVVDVIHDDAGGAQDVTTVVAVPGVEQLAVLAHDGGLHRGGAGVDADKDAAPIRGEVALGDHLRVVAGVELVELLVIGEQRVEALDLAALHVTKVLEGVDDLSEGHALVELAGKGGAGGHEQMGVGRDDAVLLVERERLVEAMAQLGEVLERTTEEGNVAANGMTACKAGDRLVGNGLEDRGGDVRGSRALVEQRLDIGLREDATAAGDRVDMGRLLRELVEPASVGVQQARHLVDERARAARAGAVHALLDAVIEVDDLGVLATELDGDVSLRNEGLDGALARNDLLDKLEVKPLGEQKSARTGNGDAHGGVAEHGAGLLEELLCRGTDVGVVALIICVDDAIRVVDDGELDRGGAHVDTQAQVGAREVRGVGGAQLGPILNQLDAAGQLGLRRIGCCGIVSHGWAPFPPRKRPRAPHCS